MVRQVSPHLLWLGNVRDAANEPLLEDLGIAALVDLTCYEAPVAVSRERCYQHFPLIDGDCNSEWILRAAVVSVGTLVRERIATLVYCGMGLSRTPVIAALALAHVGGMAPNECLAAIAGISRLDVNPGLWQAANAALIRTAQSG